MDFSSSQVKRMLRTPSHPHDECPKFTRADAPANQTWFGINVRQKHNTVATLRLIIRPHATHQRNQTTILRARASQRSVYPRFLWANEPANHTCFCIVYELLTACVFLLESEAYRVYFNRYLETSCAVYSHGSGRIVAVFQSLLLRWRDAADTIREFVKNDYKWDRELFVWWTWGWDILYQRGVGKPDRRNHNFLEMHPYVDLEENASHHLISRSRFPLKFSRF